MEELIQIEHQEVVLTDTPEIPEGATKFLYGFWQITTWKSNKKLEVSIDIPGNWLSQNIATLTYHKPPNLSKKKDHYIEFVSKTEYSPAMIQKILDLHKIFKEVKI